MPSIATIAPLTSFASASDFSHSFDVFFCGPPKPIVAMLE
jgi:transcriptional regulator GlxA family with amidase domain